MKAKRRYEKKPRRDQRRARHERDPVSKFIGDHFNAAALLDAAKGVRGPPRRGFLIAGAMSTAELGISLAMIRREKVHLIVYYGANLEEDIFNLVAHGRRARYRELTPRDEAATTRTAHESRDRYLHPGDGSNEADRERGAESDRRRRRRELFPRMNLFTRFFAAVS